MNVCKIDINVKEASSPSEGGVAICGDDGVSATTTQVDGVSLCGKGAISYSGDEGCSFSIHGKAAMSKDHGFSYCKGGGFALSGLDGTSISGIEGTATSGDSGVSVVDDEGVAKCGAYGIALGHGVDCKVQSEAWGISIASFGGSARSGCGGCIMIQYRKKEGRYCWAMGHIGEDGLKPNVFYQVDELGKFHEVEG